MELAVEIVAAVGTDIPADATCRVEVRDVTLQDAPSVTLEAVTIPVGGKAPTMMVRATFNPDTSRPERRDLTVWAHLSMDGTDRVTPGDYLTTQAYPVPRDAEKAAIQVDLRKV